MKIFFEVNVEYLGKDKAKYFAIKYAKHMMRLAKKQDKEALKIFTKLEKMVQKILICELKSYKIQNLDLHEFAERYMSINLDVISNVNLAINTLKATDNGTSNVYSCCKDILINEFGKILENINSRISRVNMYYGIIKFHQKIDYESETGRLVKDLLKKEYNVSLPWVTSQRQSMQFDKAVQAVSECTDRVTEEQIDVLKNIDAKALTV